jgi:hypothetical protein
MEEDRKVYKFLVRKPEGKTPLGRRLGAGVERIQLAQDWDRWRALANTVMNLRYLSPQSYYYCYYAK